MFKSAKKKKGMIVGFVTLETAEQAKAVVEVQQKIHSKTFKNLRNSLLTFLVLQELNGKTIGNNRTLKVSDVIERPFEKMNKAALLEKPSPTNNDDEEASLLPDAATKSRSARDAVTPLAHMSYSDQLEHKKNNLAQILKRLVSISYLLVSFFRFMKDLIFSSIILNL